MLELQECAIKPRHPPIFAFSSLNMWIPGVDLGQQIYWQICLPIGLSRQLFLITQQITNITLCSFSLRYFYMFRFLKYGYSFG